MRLVLIPQCLQVREHDEVVLLPQCLKVREHDEVVLLPQCLQVREHDEVAGQSKLFHDVQLLQFWQVFCPWVQTLQT